MFPPLIPVNLQDWLAAHRDQLKPPVGNKCLYRGEDLIVMAVGGPNARKDYHIDPYEEYFHQLEGDLLLKLLVDDKPVEVRVREGETLLLPRRVPHSPRRGSGTLGIVIERPRLPGEHDGFLWVCEACGHKLNEVTLPVSDLETQLKEAFAAYWSGDPALRTCRSCGTVMEPPPTP
ncbi:MAG: 3-hydroxyanthranilate 3,4-dioxygenase [Candidatus Sericytochromatia bacterium]|nr:3-hydroxyanthranilate 3,4-dioxygenase [Candidatus Tanganyikabacteria bacterium]